MDLLFQILFYILFLMVIVAVFVETLIVNSRLSHIRGKELPLTFTIKSQLQRLEDYKKEYGMGQEDIWYKFLKSLKVHGLKYVGIMLVLGLLAVIF